MTEHDQLQKDLDSIWTPPINAGQVKDCECTECDFCIEKERAYQDLVSRKQSAQFATTVNEDEYQLLLSSANESARIRIHLLHGTDNVWHMRCTPQDAFLTMFDLEELRDILNIILRHKEN